ncbi:hypothetical protein CSCA_1029 [Clostridium scatologenes]|uniref:Uncharacterized protein n=1 Tax=Clostridium scatologenes TaxID=1548 RepID=A0A0E3JMK6_CLOSL|nr:hypothetical protein CSCA_1029 [Clostridium scatologenes]
MNKKNKLICIKKPYNSVRIQVNERNVKRTNHAMSCFLVWNLKKYMTF